LYNICSGCRAGSVLEITRRGSVGGVLTFTVGVNHQQRHVFTLKPHKFSSYIIEFPKFEYLKVFVSWSIINVSK